MSRQLASSLFVLILLTCRGPSDDPSGTEPTSSSSEPGALPANAETMLGRAREVYAQEGPTAALPLFEEVLEAYRGVGDRSGEAVALGYLGNCYKRFGEFDRALELLGTALDMKRQLGDRLEAGKTLNHLGLVYWEMGKYDSAIEHFGQSVLVAREEQDRRLEAALLNNLSLVYDEQGDYPRSLEQYERALAIHRAEGFEEDESATLANIGGVYFYLGRYREARARYREALAISERLGLKPSASQDLGNLALCHLMLGDTQVALDTFDRALTLAREAGLEKDEAEWLRGKGTAWLNRGEYARAREAYRETIEFYETADSGRELTEALHLRGSLNVLLGDLVSAEADFRRAIELARGIGHPRAVTFNLIAIADLEHRRGRYEIAAALYAEALSAARQAEERGSVTTSLTRLALTKSKQGGHEEARGNAAEAVESATELDAPGLEAEAHQASGEVAFAMGDFEDALVSFAAGEALAEEILQPDLHWRNAFGRGRALEALERREEALAAYQRAARTIETVRSQLGEERFRAGYIEDKYQVYVAIVRLQLDLGDVQAAFRAGEMLRARNYLETIHLGRFRTGAGKLNVSVVEVGQKIRRLQGNLEEEMARSSSERRERAVQVLSSELEEAEALFRELVHSLQETDPRYASVLAMSIPSVDEIQEQLPVDTALIEYVLDEEELTAFVITPRESFATKVPTRRIDVRAKVELIRELIGRRSSNAWIRPAESLRESLITPLESAGWLEGVERLYIVPHGILHYLPFGALVRFSERGEVFLAEDFVLAALPAAAALLRGARSYEKPLTLLAVAPANARLQHVPEEARGVERRFAGESTILLGEAASEDAFKRLAPRHDILHLATHGRFDKQNPLFSFVQLVPGEGEDGRLEVQEILALGLHAELVALSACQTALGSGYFTEVPEGDDFVGLTRAFLFAGAEAVVATLWEVDDRSTLQLMNAFYEKWGEDRNARSLAEAQRAMIGTGSAYRHPYYWAPFVLVGGM